MQKPIPEFKDEAEERQFWVKNDSSDHLDWDQAERVVFPKLKPSIKRARGFLKGIETSVKRENDRM